MRRSLAYAAASAPRDGDEAWLGEWETEARRAFTEGYRAATRGAPFIPAGAEAFERVVAAFELEKAAYEIVYEANNRPDWLAIPTRGLVSAAAALARPESPGAA
jgi:maltose alpha-D-glucosyltransferase/alpha-amylase